MKTSFIYKPKAGDRVFAFKPAASVAVLEYQNGCRHIVAPGVLSHAGDRTLIRRVFAALVEARGGIAWDDRGLVYYAGPALLAAADALVRLCGADRAEIDVQLIKCGAAMAWRGDTVVCAAAPEALPIGAVSVAYEDATSQTGVPRKRHATYIQVGANALCFQAPWHPERVWAGTELLVVSPAVEDAWYQVARENTTFEAMPYAAELAASQAPYADLDTAFQVEEDEVGE